MTSNNNIGNKKYNIWKLLILPIIISILLLLPTITIGSISSVNDDDAPEISIDEIISPPSYGKTGNYDVTVRFTTVGIIINGSRDYNEPWVRHEESPDNNGTPNIDFYTSCDEDYMYVAFENQTDGILAGEIFIDKNMNGTWDGPFEDSFFTIDYLGSNKDKVKDHNGDIVPNSLVGWGDKSFVEVKIPKTYWSICNDWAYRVRSTPLGNSDCNSISLPPCPVNMSIVYGTDSYFITTLSDVPLGYDVTNGVYVGWCVDQSHSINVSGKEYFTTLWCSYNPPAPWQDDDWDMVNYIINHKHPDATKADIQEAIWYFVNGGNNASTDIGWSMVENATNFGEGFMSSIGEWCAILCDAGECVQKTFIEVQVPADDNGWNPSWGNNTHPLITPPDGKFLTFICDYGDFNCPCGVAIKALVDIFKINSGECSTIYETDFENLSNVTRDWKAESLDTNPDTWNLSENKSNSPSHSFHCTNNANYYGNALDVLEMRNPVDLSDVVNISFSFWHWCKGDVYTSNGHTKIVDYGDVEIYANSHENWTWISLSDLAISNLYYDNGWTQTIIKIERSKSYPLDGENISGEQLLTNKAKFRFVWKSSPQFQYEGWYIDDVKIRACKGEWYDDSHSIWQGHGIPCIPFNSTIIYTFPLQWNANEEGKYLVRVCFQEEPPWHGPLNACKEKIVTIGDIHDIAVTSLKALNNIDKGEDLHIEATIKNVGTYDETNVQVKATIKREEDGTTVWQETVIIPTLNVSDKIILDFAWEDATYCDHILEVRAILPEDEIPENNSKSKTVIVATTIFEDHMNNECKWTHSDLTGGEGHWDICTSGDDNYLWCGIPETTKYGNNWNDVAMTNHSFDLSSSHSSILLTFDSYHRINKSDCGYVEISPDGGMHWETISDFTGYSDWESYTYDISAYDTNNVKIRFRFFSNESITDRGWILGNITISNETSIFFNDNFESGNTNQWIIERQKAGDWWQIVKKEKDCNTNNMAWWCGDKLSGIYPPNLDNVLILNKQCTSAIDFSKAFDASVLFSTWYNISEGDLGILEISDNDGATWNVIGSITGKSLEWTSKLYNIKEYVGGEISIRFRFISDNVNESEGWYIDDFKIVAKFDFDPPVTTCTLSGTMGKNDWYVSTVQITLTAVDDYTGVKHIYYKLLDDGIGVQTTYSSPITVSDGNYTIEYWSEDNIGNIEPHHGPTSFKIDSVNPSVNITRPDNGIYWRDHKLWPLIKWSLFKWATPLIIRDITIIADAQDNMSGVDYVEFYIDSGSTPMSTSSNEPFEWNWDETVFFTHTITVKAYDKAGNTDSMSKDVKIFNINLFR